MKKVSIIIPVFNGIATVGYTVDSALSQCYQNKEIIVVDDCSNDGTWEWLNKRYSGHVVLIRHETNKGGSAARNTGIEVATGEYVAFLDADDEWYPNKLLDQVDTLENSLVPNCVAVYCNAHNDQHEVVGGSHTGQFIPEVLNGEANIVSSSALLIKSRVLNEINGFDPVFMRHQDIELIIRLMKLGGIDVVNKPLFKKKFSGDASKRAVVQGISCFWKKFENDITNLNKRDQRMVYARGYLRFFEVCYKDSQYLQSIYYFVRSIFYTPRALWKKKEKYSLSLNKRLS